MTMTIGDVTKLGQAIKRAVPIIYADREYMEPSDYKEGTVFKIDDKPLVVEKIKREKDPKTGLWNEVTNLKGEPIIRRIAYIPILMGGKKYILCTTSRNITNLMDILDGEVTGDVATKGGRVWISKVLIGGDCLIKYVPEKYGDKSYDIPIIVDA